jgi:hypothetical protein
MNFNIKDMIGSLVEDDGKGRQVTQDTPKPAPPPITPSVAIPAPDLSGPLDKQDEVYQRLVAKTDFTTTPPFKSINKYLGPIASLQLDEKTKFKIALQQAQAQDGLDASTVTAVFDQCCDILKTESDRFAQASAQATAEQVDAKSAKALAIADQIKALQSEAAQLAEESFASQQKIQTAQHRFELAVQARRSELQSEQAKYAGLIS